LEGAWRYGLAASDKPLFASTRDAFPFAGTLQKLPSAFLPFNSALPNNKVPIGIHELEIKGLGFFASHKPKDTHGMEGAVIEDLVLVIAPADRLGIPA